MTLIENVLINLLRITDPMRICQNLWALALEKFTRRTGTNISYKCRGLLT